MGFQIDVRRVIGVLLADGWHDVAPATLGVGPYGYTDGRNTQLNVGDGFQFQEEHDAGVSTFMGPFSSILAIRYRP